LDKIKSGQNLMTIAKASKETGISAGVIRKAFKEGGVKPDLVEAGCSYYSKTTVDSIVKKLKKA
jgi:predicted site-specific integrase-resolvase